MKISLDTNILLDTPQIVFDESRQFVLSFTVIRELDKLKRNLDLKIAAQQAIKNIWYQLQKDKIEILNVPNLLGESPDEKIIQDTKESNASILSNDIAVRIIAKAHGIEISGFEADDNIDYDYTGYKYIKSNPEYNKTIRTLKEMPTPEFELLMNSEEIKLNQYIIIDDGSENPDIWKNIDGTMYRISQKMGPYTSAGINGIQPMDPVQMCVLDAVFDPICPLVVVDGPLGCGKTLLSMMSALATVQGENRYMFYDQIYITASPQSVNRSLYTGYKPGTSEEKLSGHLSGFKSNLKFLLDPKRSKENRKNKKEDEDIEKPSDKCWRDNFTVVEIDEIQGASLHNTIFLVDEFQKLSEESLKLLLSRIAEGSKIVLMGDTVGQVYGLNRGVEGFKKLYTKFGKANEFSYIKMENIYRSELAKFVEELFD